MVNHEVTVGPDGYTVECDGDVVVDHEGYHCVHPPDYGTCTECGADRMQLSLSTFAGAMRLALVCSADLGHEPL